MGRQAGFDQVIPLDEVITAMDAVGRRIPTELRCTALGGLSVTPCIQSNNEKAQNLSIMGFSGLVRFNG